MVLCGAIQNQNYSKRSGFAVTHELGDRYFLFCKISALAALTNQYPGSTGGCHEGTPRLRRLPYAIDRIAACSVCRAVSAPARPLRPMAVQHLDGLPRVGNHTAAGIPEFELNRVGKGCIAHH